MSICVCNWRFGLFNMDSSPEFQAEVTAPQRKDDIVSNPSSPAQTSLKLYKKRWIVLAIFSLVSMTNEVIWISLSSITSIVEVYYGVPYIAVNWLSMVYMLFYLFVIPTSYILDKYGLRFTIVIGTVLNGLGSTFRCIGANRDGFVLAFLGNSFAALAQCFILFIPPRLAAVWFGDHERSTASAIGVLMNMLGVAIGFLMGGTIVPSSADMDSDVRLGMYTLLMSQAIFCTILVLAAVIFIKDEPESPPSMSQALLRDLKAKKVNLSVAPEKRENDTSKKATCDAGKVLGDIPTSLFEDEVDGHPPSFFQSFVRLFKNYQFHLIVQAYGFYFGLFAAYNTILNQMVTPYYHGMEKQIGLMGFAAVICGLFGIFLGGLWLDKLKRFKLLSGIIFACCALSMVAFTLLLRYDRNFTVLFISFCIFGFFSYPYMSVGLEHAAEITYPIPEGTTSGILLLTGNIYGIILTYIVGAIIEKGGSDVGGYIMASAYGVGLVMVLVVNAPLKRTEADQIHK